MENKITNTQEYQKALEQIKQLSQAVSDFESQVKQEAQVEFEKDDKLSKISKDGLVISRVRSEYKTPMKPLEVLFIEEDEFVKIDYKQDTEKLNQYMKEHNGQLPENWGVRVTERIDIKLAKK